jgi:hypothetical protein
MQSPRRSAIESVVNLVVGYAAAVTTQLAVFPLLHIHVPFETNFIIGGLFSLTSIVRTYLLRRAFARWEGSR